MNRQARRALQPCLPKAAHSASRAAHVKVTEQGVAVARQEQSLPVGVACVEL